MVGVPGRSKGCNTCLQRKIKCDESRPTCMRCQRAGYQCRGYERPIHFFIMSTAQSSSPQPNNQHGNDVSKMQTSEISMDEGTPRSLSLVAFKNDMQLAFLFDNFVWNSYGAPWLQIAAEGKFNSMSKNACQAFSEIVFGKYYCQEEIQTKGALHYSQALQSLISNLQNPEPETGAALIIPIIVLLMYSSSENDIKASIFHVQGLVRLLLLCGPAAFRASPVRFAFESCRATLVITGLIQKKRLFLEQDVWRTTPWSDAPLEKSPQNYLIDILVMLPGLLEDEALLENEHSPSDISKQNLLLGVSTQLEKLFRWRWDWEEHNAKSSAEIEPQLLNLFQPLPNSRPFQAVLYFSSFTQATEISLYNAVLLCLLGLLWNLEPEVHSTLATMTVLAQSTAPPHLATISATPLKLPGMASSVRDVAIEICRAFEYQLLNAKGCRERALYWLFPLGIAHRVLEDDPVFSRWIVEMLNISDITRGYGTGKNAFGFGFYRLPKMAK